MPVRSPPKIDESYDFWNASTTGAFEIVNRWLAHLDMQQGSRASDFWHFGRLYRGMRPDFRVGNAWTYLSSQASAVDKVPRFTYNTVKAAVDTAVARLTEQPVRPMMLTSGADEIDQAKARQMQDWVDGWLYVVKAEKLRRECLRDAARFGVGIAKVYIEHDQVKAKRKFPLFVMVDEMDCISEAPRRIAERSFIAREVLAEDYKNDAAKLELVKNANASTQPNTRGGVHLPTDIIEVVDVYHLPSGPTATDGVHLRVVSSGELEREKWDRDFFPFVMVAWDEPELGFWPQGLIENQMGKQIEINHTVRTIQKALRGSVPSVWVEKGSEYDISSFNDDVWNVYEFSGIKPEFQVAQSVAPELLQHLESTKADVFNESGISQMAAQNQLPPGLKSGEAQKVYADNQDKRWNDKQKSSQEFVLDLVEQGFDAIRRWVDAKGKSDFKVTVPRSRGGAQVLETVTAAELDLDRNKYRLRIYATNALREDPAGRLDDIQELAQAAQIPPEMLLSLIDFPDIEYATSLLSAPVVYALKQIAKIMEDGDFEGPDEYQLIEAPDFTLKLFRLAYLRAMAKPDSKTGARKERIAMLRTWMEQADALMHPPAQQAPAGPPAGPPGAGGAPPPGGPGPVGQAAPPPMSPLLPNGAGAPPGPNS